MGAGHGGEGEPLGRVVSTTSEGSLERKKNTDFTAAELLRVSRLQRLRPCAPSARATSEGEGGPKSCARGRGSGRVEGGGVGTAHAGRHQGRGGRERAGGGGGAAGRAGCGSPRSGPGGRRAATVALTLRGVALGGPRREGSGKEGRGRRPESSRWRRFTFAAAARAPKPDPAHFLASGGGCFQTLGGVTGNLAGGESGANNQYPLRPTLSESLLNPRGGPQTC